MICVKCGENKAVVFYVDIEALKVKGNVCGLCLGEVERQKVCLVDEAERDYVMSWKLRNEKGEEWIEEMEHMSLSDIEIVYRNNIYDIIWCKFRKTYRIFN